MLQLVAYGDLRGVFCVSSFISLAHFSSTVCRSYLKKNIRRCFYRVVVYRTLYQTDCFCCFVLLFYTLRPRERYGGCQLYCCFFCKRSLQSWVSSIQSVVLTADVFSIFFYRKNSLVCWLAQVGFALVSFAVGIAWLNHRLLCFQFVSLVTLLCGHRYRLSRRRRWHGHWLCWM